MSTVQTVHAHGLGTVESEIQFFNDNFYKVKVQTNPDVLHGDESEIGLQISTINHDKDSIVSNIEYFVDVIDPKTGDSILSFNAYSPNESFIAKIIPKNQIDFLRMAFLLQLLHQIQFGSECLQWCSCLLQLG